MSDTFSGIPWFVATRPQKVVLWLRHWWAELAVALGVLTVLGAQLARAYLAGRVPF